MKSQYPIGLHINKLSRLISRKVDAAVLSAIDDNITVSQAYVIDFITDNNDRDVFQKDLEMEFDLKRSSVSLMLNNMEKHDLIKRVPVAEDARLKKIILTEKAIELSKKIAYAIDSVEGILAENLNQDEINTFLALISLIDSIYFSVLIPSFNFTNAQVILVSGLFPSKKLVGKLIFDNFLN